MPRWIRVVLLGSGLVLFGSPFLFVSCDTPGGFGRTSAGGTTEWTGYDLVTGSEPDRSIDHLRTAAESTEDVLAPQPVLAAALALLIAATVCALVLVRPQLRRGVSALSAATTAVLLGTGTLLARHEVIGRVGAELSGRTLPDGNEPADYVALGSGFRLTLVALAVVAIADGIAWWRGRFGGGNPVTVLALLAVSATDPVRRRLGRSGRPGTDGPAD